MEVEEAVAAEIEKQCKAKIEELKDWDFLQTLPKKILNFDLTVNFDICGQEIIMAAYTNNDRCALELGFTVETDDFVVVKRVGLNRFRDERFFAKTREGFVNLLLPKLSQLVSDVDRKSGHQYSFSGVSIGIDKWQGWHDLPKQVGEMELFITPDTPLQILNGSYVMIDYSDFATRNQLLIMYNEYRNEIYGELKQQGIPCFTKKFDLQYDEKKHGMNEGLFIKDFEELLKKNLIPVLQEFDKAKKS